MSTLIILFVTLAPPGEVYIEEVTLPNDAHQLTCVPEYEGSSNVYNWSVPAPNSVLGRGGNTLIIEGYSTSSGVYQCTVENRFGCGTGQINITFTSENISSNSVIMQYVNYH